MADISIVNGIINQQTSLGGTTLYICIFGWWFGTWLLFFHILEIIIPTDELIFFRGVGIPLTRHDKHDDFFLFQLGDLSVRNMFNFSRGYPGNRVQ